jgi:hypothetical protein
MSFGPFMASRMLENEPRQIEAHGGLGSSVSKPTDRTLSALLSKIGMFYMIFKVKVAVPVPPSSSSTVTVTT